MRTNEKGNMKHRCHLVRDCESLLYAIKDGLEDQRHVHAGPRHSITLQRCKKCGQLFMSVFLEHHYRKNEEEDALGTNAYAAKQLKLKLGTYRPLPEKELYDIFIPLEGAGSENIGQQESWKEYLVRLLKTHDYIMIRDGTLFWMELGPIHEWMVNLELVSRIADTD